MYMASAATRYGGGLLIFSALSRPRTLLTRASSPFSMGLLHLRPNDEKASRYVCLLPSSCSRHASSCLPPHAATMDTGDEASISSYPLEISDPVKAAAGSLDIRVGCILKAWRHPEADTLYVEEVDIGEPETRTICSGLVNYIPLDHLQNVKVIVLVNLKARNMRGVKSNGMLMAASDASHETVELLVPPEGSVPGERIWFGTEEEKDKQPDAATPNQVQKKKIWEFVQPHLRTTDSGIAVVGEHPMRASTGVISCRSLRNAYIS